MKAFFLKHPLTRKNENSGPPGRFRFDIAANALGRLGNTYNLAKYDGSIYADGRADNKPASNIDPNVFSDVIPWFHTYCLIDASPDPKSDMKRFVYDAVAQQETPHRLPESTVPGDVIIYGNTIYGNTREPNVLFIDTVICVEQCIPVPQKDGRFDIDAYYNTYKSALGLPDTFHEFKHTRTYYCNLVAAEPPHGRHQLTHNRDPHYQIIGRHAETSSIQKTTATALLTQFINGNGFNFIPLRKMCCSDDAEIVARPGIFTAKFTRNVRDELTHSITELPSGFAEDILVALLGQSDRLVIGQIEPKKTLHCEQFAH
jgi:hypothetical protein